MKNKFLKRFFILFLLCTVVTVSVHTQYKTAQADALVLPMVVKAGASLLGLSVGGLLGTVIGGVALLYGTYYVVDNWHEITTDVHNALVGTSGAVAEWYDNITSSAVHKDDPVYKMKDKISAGEVVNIFDYKKPKEPNRKIDVTPAVIKFIKDRLDKKLEKIETPIGIRKYSYYDYVSSLPDDNPLKMYFNSSQSARDGVMWFDNNTLIVEGHETFSDKVFRLRNYNDYQLTENILEISLNYYKDSIIFNHKFVARDNSNYTANWESAYTSPSGWSFSSPTWYGYNFSIDLTTSETESIRSTGKLTHEQKTRILEEFKTKLRFTNYDVNIYQDIDLLGIDKIGGNIYNTPTEDLISKPIPTPTPIPNDTLSIYETDAFLDELSKLDMTSKANTKELSDNLNDIKEILENMGEPSIEINVPETPPFDASEIIQNIKDLPNQIRDNSKGLIDDALSTDNLDLPSNVQPILDTLDNRLSILSYPMSLLIQIITRIIYSNQIDCILHFPPLKVFGTTFYNGTSFNFTAFFRQEPFIYIRYLTQLFTSSYFTFQLFGLFKRKLDEIIKGGAGYNS